MSKEMNEVMVNDVSFSFDLSMLSEGSNNFVCSIPDDGSRTAKVAIYNAVQNADEQLSEHVNEVLEIVDIVAHPIQLPDERTGEVINAIRTVLIDKNGTGYQAVSNGICQALSKIIAIIGQPHWDEPVKMKPVLRKSKNSRPLNYLMQCATNAILQAKSAKFLRANCAWCWMC